MYESLNASALKHLLQMGSSRKTLVLQVKNYGNSFIIPVNNILTEIVIHVIFFAIVNDVL